MWIMEYSKQLKELSDLMAFIYRDDDMEILSIPNYTYNETICFCVKCYKKPESDWAEGFRFCRISMKSPEYIITENGNDFLTNEEIEKVVRLLTSKDHGEIDLWNNLNKTNWELLIREHNWELSGTDNHDWTPLPEDFPIPDYRQLMK